MHPLPNNHIQILPVQLPPPPPDNMYLNDDENNPEPHEAAQETLRHPILNGKAFICSFCLIFNSLLY
jgi:hypothetical protein